MASMKAYLNLSNGKKQDFHVKTVVKQVEDVQAVYIDGFTNVKIDSEFGAGIELAIEGVRAGWQIIATVNSGAARSLEVI